ncbi:hypothetical protein vBAbaPP1_73 [Acinetobacter phage vB_AbaM_P1]|nr:hypothetical protein vBAbaPP1_73 [Acinetobacter phage vB_AbaM_P1]
MDLNEVGAKAKKFLDDRIAQLTSLDATAILEIAENPIYHDKFTEFIETCCPELDVDEKYVVDAINKHFSEALGVEATVGQIFDESICVEMIMQPFFVEALKEYVGYQK